MIQPIDWSATAAWIALIISVVGTIVGPIVTALINNAHQTKLYILESTSKEKSEKDTIIRECISGIGKVLSFSSSTNIEQFGQTFHACYAYVPTDKWHLLDNFYSDIIDEDYDSAQNKLSDIIHLLSEILKEKQQ